LADWLALSTLQDLICGVNGKNILLEIKDGLARPSEQTLTADEKVWHACWRGEVHVVKSADEALKLILAARRES